MGLARARIEPSLGARVVKRTPLLYDRGADLQHDRPAHVRAGSALARLGEHTLAVVQDDASFLAVLEGVGDAAAAALRVRDVALPAREGVRLFDDERGNKGLKLDLEACLVVDDGALLVAFGSGSTERRERVVLVDRPGSPDPQITVVEAGALYAALRASAELAGSELNIEGAALAGPDVLLLQRGNGAPTGARAAVDATGRLDRRALLAYLRGLAGGSTSTAPTCPPLRDVVQWSLGNVMGTRLTFTDGVSRPGPWTAFLACAEASPDATRDGPVSGVSIGRLDDVQRTAELAPVDDEHGAPLTDKAEGLAFDERDPRRAWLVIDRDDPAAPAELLELRLGEGWIP
ncbi:MAG TPA: hypothetical protein VLT33_22900 [Labilithrix sp.]|nr:hypothetical protein [Labilithrix sp.]